jgi:hypothetical protein
LTVHIERMVYKSVLWLDGDIKLAIPSYFI